MAQAGALASELVVVELQAALGLGFDRPAVAEEALTRWRVRSRSSG